MSSVINTNKAKNLIENDFPIEVRCKLAASIKQAYEYLEDLKNDLEILQIASSKNHFSRIRNLVVDLILKKDIDNGIISFDYEFMNNEANNHKHIEVKSDNFIMTVSQVNNKNQLPRDAKFRNNLGLCNQMQFNFNNRFLHDLSPVNTYYILLTHGSNSMDPEFINLGVPDVVNKKWIKRFDILDELYRSNIERKDNEDRKDQLVKLRSTIRKEWSKNEAK